MCVRDGSKGRGDSHHQTVTNKGGYELIERSFILKDEMGLHARPAAMLMVRMLRVSSSVEIICGDRRADGKDVMSIMAMNTTAGDEVIFRIDGPDEEAAMKEVEAVLETGA